MSRKTAKLILYNDVVDSLRDWVADVFFPEEFFYATLATLDRGKLGEGEVIQGKPCICFKTKPTLIVNDKHCHNLVIAIRIIPLFVET